VWCRSHLTPPVTEAVWLPVNSGRGNQDCQCWQGIPWGGGAAAAVHEYGQGDGYSLRWAARLRLSWLFLVMLRNARSAFDLFAVIQFHCRAASWTCSSCCLSAIMRVFSNTIQLQVWRQWRVGGSLPE
jgi:hypothetical protein